MKYKAVLFDLDGTLLNTLDDLYYSTNYALKAHNMKERTFEEVRCFVGNGVKVLIEKAVEPNRINEVEDVLTTFKQHYQEHSLDHISIYPGINELLQELINQNILIAVVTNKFDNAAQNIISKYFPTQVNITLGEKPPLNKKPHPDMCNYVLNKLGLTKEEVIYVGDSEVDILTAKNAGLKSVSCAWGFRTKEELLKANGNIIIDDPMEIINILKK